MCKCDTTARAFNELARVAYATKYPSYCQHCGGWGGSVYSYDPSPAGVSLSSGCMYDWEPCPECLEKGICPRCGTQHDPDSEWWAEPSGCPSCGWTEDDGTEWHRQTDGMPPPWECYCWEDDIPDWDPYENEARSVRDDQVPCDC